LNAWLEQFGTNHWMHPDNDLDKEAQAAIRHFGTNEIPTYLKQMTARESRFRLKLMAVVPTRWRARLHVPDALAYENELHHERTLGAYGIVALGQEAKPVVPFLMGLLKDYDRDVRCTSVFTLRSLKSVAHEALPLLINCLKDPDSSVRFNAILSLGEIHQEPERTIPILIEYLDVQDLGLRVGALWSLRQFRAEAKPAFTNVLKLINDGDASIRNEATNVLIAIDPEAAAKAGVQYH
jgi:hypothetical protein